jgi:hypothetical protein
MKSAKGYVVFVLGWALALLAAYYGWGQGLESVQNVYVLLLVVGVILQVFLFAIAVGFAVMSDETWNALKKKPQPTEVTFTFGFAMTSLLAKALMFAWFGAFWVGLAVFIFGMTGRLLIEVNNTVIAKRMSP